MDTDSSVSTEALVTVSKPGPRSIEELQAVLSSMDNTIEISTTGGYPFALGEEEEALLSALDSLREQGYNVGFVMMDLSTGYGVSCNPDMTFYSASSIKAPYVVSLAAAYPEAIEAWEPTMRTAIEYSDNDAYFALRSAFGADCLRQWCEDAGVDPSICDEWSTMRQEPTWFPDYSTKTLAKLWLQNYEYLESGSEQVEVVDSLFSSTYNSAIYACLGSTTEVRTKGGWISEEGYATTSDAGIVYAGENGNSPYLLVIMSDIPRDSTQLEPLVYALNDIHDAIGSRLDRGDASGANTSVTAIAAEATTRS